MEAPGYEPMKTIGKALPPAITAVAVECVDAAFQSAGIAIGKDHLYQIGTAICCLYLSFVNWAKNRRKRIKK